jgi:hypothetical protein
VRAFVRVVGDQRRAAKALTALTRSTLSPYDPSKKKLVVLMFDEEQSRFLQKFSLRPLPPPTLAAGQLQATLWLQFHPFCNHGDDPAVPPSHIQPRLLR